MLRYLTTIIVAVLAFVCVAPAQTTQPIVTTSYAQAGTPFPARVTGWPAVFQVEPEWLAVKLPMIASIDAAILIDHEPKGMVWRMDPGQLANTKAKARVRELDEWAAECKRMLLEVRRVAPTRRVILFTHWPFGKSWQYPAGQDQSKSTPDSKRLGRSDVFSLFDAVAFHAYLHTDDAGWMTPADAAEYTRRRIDAAVAGNVLNRPLILVLSQNWSPLHTAPLPDNLYVAQLRVARQRGIEVMDWVPNATPDQASRNGERLGKLLEASK